MSKPAPAFQGAAIESAGKDSNKIRRHDLQAAGKKFQQHDSHGNQSQNNSGRVGRGVSDKDARSKALFFSSRINRLQHRPDSLSAR